jgi:hypothetical protein
MPSCDGATGILLDTITEHFGPPAILNSYCSKWACIYDPVTSNAFVYFKTEEDAVLCRMLLS